MNIAIITGASAGLGREYARQIDAAFHKLDEIWLIARREERLKDLARELSTPVRILPFDLTDADDVAALQRELISVHPSVRMLVNSAGYGIIGDFAEGEIADELGMINLNCVTLTAVTQICLPFMMRKSRIIQMASSASFLPQPGFAIYAATKSFVLSFSRALNRELKGRGISVTAVCPGPVSTEFFCKAEKKHKMPAYKMVAMAAPGDVVKKALSDSLRRKDVSVYGLSMKALQAVTKLLPHRFILSVFDALQEVCK